MSTRNKIRYANLDAGKAFDKYFDLTMKNAESVRARLQVLLFAAVSHYLQHGDYTRANKIVTAAIGLKGFNTRNMVKYLQLYAGLMANPVWSDAKQKDVTPDEFNGHSGFHLLPEQEKAELLAKAASNMWWETIKIANPFKDVSNDAIISRALDEIGKARERAVKAANDAGEDPAEFLAKHVDETISPATTRRVLKFMKVDEAIIEEKAQLALVG